MSDNFKNGRATDRSRVSMNEEQEIRYRTEYLGCTKGELAAAVARVGSSPDVVRRELYRHWAYGTFRVGDATKTKMGLGARHPTLLPAGN
jgi:Protein of unknown function (DUF3606)